MRVSVLNGLSDKFKKWRYDMGTFSTEFEQGLLDRVDVLTQKNL